MDRHRIELQIRSILVTYRVERRRRDAPTMRAFRERAHRLLNGVADAARGDPELAARLEEARRELDEA